MCGYPTPQPRQSLTFRNILLKTKHRGNRRSNIEDGPNLCKSKVGFWRPKYIAHWAYFHSLLSDSSDGFWAALTPVGQGQLETERKGAVLLGQ